MASQNGLASTKGDGDLDSVPDMPEPRKDELRRARKRATDRKSQRQHRERQRAYIRQLEERLETFTTSFAQSSNGEIATLLKEQERLLAKCKKYEAALLRISGLASSVNEGQLDGIQVIPEGPSRAGLEANRSCAPSTTQRMTPPADNASTSSGHQPETPCGSSISPIDQDLLPTTSAAMMEMRDTIPPLDLDFLDLSDCLPVATGRHNTEAADIDLAHADASPSDDGQTTEITDDRDVHELNGLQDSSTDLCIASILDATAVGLELMPTFFSHPDPLMAHTQIQTSSRNGLPAHLAFPKVSSDLGAWDKIIVNMVNEARLEYQCGNMSADEPRLRNVLSSKLTDVLASRLYHHICSFGPMPLHLLLSIFWVQYLLLRWHVFATRADFLRLPDFMRPTELERRLPHRACIGMLVWPDIRRALIRDSAVIDPEYIGIELLSHMNSNWVPTACVTGELIGSTDIFAVIEQQACKAEFWKVDRSFKEKHRSFVNCELC